MPPFLPPLAWLDDARRTQKSERLPGSPRVRPHRNCPVACEERCGDDPRGPLIRANDVGPTSRQTETEAWCVATLCALCRNCVSQRCRVCCAREAQHGPGPSPPAYAYADAQRTLTPNAFTALGCWQVHLPQRLSPNRSLRWQLSRARQGLLLGQLQSHRLLPKSCPKCMPHLPLSRRRLPRALSSMPC